MHFLLRPEVHSEHAMMNVCDEPQSMHFSFPADKRMVAYGQYYSNGTMIEYKSRYSTGRIVWHSK